MIFKERCEKGTIFKQLVNWEKREYIYYMILKGSLSSSIHGYMYYPNKLTIQRCKIETIMIHPLAINDFRNKEYKMVEIYHYIPDDKYLEVSFKPNTNFSVRDGDLYEDNYFIADVKF